MNKQGTTRRTFTSAAMLGPVAALLHAQGAKKSFTFRGKVESIDAPSKSMTIDGDKVEGWMEAMSMKYTIDNADVFKTVKVGDTIAVSYTHLRAHETGRNIVCRL